MAQVNIQFDTSTKQLTATIDGKEVPYLECVSISKRYSYDDEEEEKFSMCLTTSDKTLQEDEGYQTFTQIVANQSEDAKDYLGQGAKKYSEHPDFITLSRKEMKDKKVQNFVSKYMKARKGR